MRGLGLLIGVCAVLLLAPAGDAQASSRQISMFQDDAVLLGYTNKDPDAAMAEIKYLGGDMVRVFVTWSDLVPGAKDRTPPAGFDIGNPDSPGWNWAPYDRFVQRARANGLEVMFTLTGSIPYWASAEPTVCPHHIGGHARLGLSCFWKPRPDLFGLFARSVATRYRGLVDLYSLWNEPNLEHYLYPQIERTKGGTVDVGAKQARELWMAGYKGLTAADPTTRNHVLFGETAAISSPLDTLYASLCLDPKGKPFTGRRKQLQGCSKPARLPIAGLAVHPYNRNALGSVFTRSATKDSMPLAYVSRATHVLRQASRYGRIPHGRGIYITEFGFQSNPPDARGLGLQTQARALNQSDRLFFGDPRVRATNQFELYDVPDDQAGEDVYNTGLRLIDGGLKPAWGAYRMPLVVTRKAAGRVEVWGQVRPAEGRTRPTVSAARPGKAFRPIRRPLTNPSGFFRFTYRATGAERLRYRVTWPAPNGETFPSRVATAGRPIRYLEPR